jgi:hypothetical protein
MMPAKAVLCALARQAPAMFQVDRIRQFQKHSGRTLGDAANGSSSSTATIFGLAAGSGLSRQTKELI